MKKIPFLDKSRELLPDSSDNSSQNEFENFTEDARYPTCISDHVSSSARVKIGKCSLGTKRQ